MQEIYDQEKHIEALKKALRDKGPPLKVAQTRLEARAHRPDVELCRDPPHLRLVEEASVYSHHCIFHFALQVDLYLYLYFLLRLVSCKRALIF